MNIIALDLGTKMGWAYSCGPTSVYSGSQNFTLRKSEDPAQRWLKFRAFLTDIAGRLPEVHAVYFEEVHRHVGTDAAHVYGGFLALLQVWCQINHYQVRGVGVGTVKKHWTGKGNAKKDEMILSAQKRGFTVKDDNAADALAILSLARQIEGVSILSDEARRLFPASAARIDEILATNRTTSPAPAREEITTVFDRPL